MKTLFLASALAVALSSPAAAQDKLKTSYASIGATNAIWNVAKERGFYRKHGLDTEVVYIGSTTVTIAAILGQDVPIAMAGGNGVANAAVNGADLLSVACFVNTIDFDLVVHHPSVRPMLSKAKRSPSAGSAASRMSPLANCLKAWVCAPSKMSNCAKSAPRRTTSPPSPKARWRVSSTLPAVCI